jgi:molybdopterin-containing oxidoreductase family iron-sulfur binding subunit
MPQGNEQLDFTEIRLKLQAAQGKRYWRSLEEVADTPQFQEMLYKEFPQQAPDWLDSVSRRKFLMLAGASIALAGVMTGCARPPQDRIVPYVRPPQNMIPGKPLFFASAMPFRGVGQGVVVTSREGRPIKIEGNPDHPDSLGATNVFGQASVLGMWDPDRSQAVLKLGEPSSWSDFIAALYQRLESKKSKDGTGIRILSRSTSSPTLAANIQKFLKAYPQAQWHHYEPVSRDTVRAGAKLAFGQRLDPIYHFEKADVVLSLDSDFLFAEPGSLRYARHFADRRRMRLVNKKGDPVDPKSLTMNRLYVAECGTSLAGGMSDHRLPVKPSELLHLAATMATAVGVSSAPAGASLSATAKAWVDKVAADLSANRGKSIVIAGDAQPAELHALAFAINSALGNIGKTVTFIDPVDSHPQASTDSLQTLVNDIKAGQVDTLLIMGANPVYDAPGEFEFLTTLKQIDLRIHLGEYFDETGFECHWHIPEAHYLEAWGDIRAFDGTVSIIQPLIAPLYAGKSAIELTNVLLGTPDTTGYETLRSFWLQQSKSGDFEGWWKKTLEKGVVADSASPHRDVTAAANLPIELPPAASSAMQAVFRPDMTVWDGRFANNGWLQELPKPLTHMTWDNAVMVSPRTAEKQSLKNGDIVEVNVGSRKVEGAVWVMPGQPDDVITLPLGYGRQRAGRVGGTETESPGFNFYKVRANTAASVAAVTITKTDRTYHLVATHVNHAIWERKLGSWIKDPGVVGRPPEHEHDAGNPLTHDDAEREINNRNLIRVATLEQFKADPHFARKIDEGETTQIDPANPSSKRVQLQLFNSYEYDNINKHRWGMSIDTHSCIGCNACVVACQSENNISVVGKDQVDRGREMHWIRLDTYYAGDIDNPETYFEPVPCMHCENAPCELVCPVGATVHDDEGINSMVYNRCVGTRYCSNNCPYKVRRFNFLHFSDVLTESERLGTNPEVTIRTRGVMEKCTYCIQRINNTRIEAEKMQVQLEEQYNNSKNEADRKMLKKRLEETTAHLWNGLQTACQQSCPTRAITFGDMNDNKSEIFRAKQEPHDFGLLEELTTKPRTTYLARVRNPNPALQTTKAENENLG